MAELFFMNGPHRGKVFVIEGGVTYMGRSRDNHIQVKQASVSRHHLKVLLKGGTFLIKDLGSTNGTLLRGLRIIPGKEYEVKTGEHIEIGDIRFALGEAVSDRDDEARASFDTAKELDTTTMLPAFDTTRDTADNIEFFSKVSKALMESLDLNEVFQKTLHYLFHLLKRIDRGFIIILDDKTYKILDVVSQYRENIDDSTGYSKTVVEQVIRERKPIVMSDLRPESDENLS
ncbi:MAG: FHA domain-containing protein, partial [Deltaproteobacteria bacterium]